MGRRRFSTTEKMLFQKSRVKTMLIVFFDSQGTVHNVVVQEGYPVNAQYYKGVLERLISHIRRVRPALYRTRDFFLLHDNAPAHSAAKILQFLTRKQVATFNHSPPYSTDLSPPDYFLLPNVKLQLKGARFDISRDRPAK